MKSSIRIGTRGSQLALYQAELAKAKIQADFPILQIEIVKIRTSGDMTRRNTANPLETKRVFTREIEEALVQNEIDIAVHSAKDLAVTMPKGLKIAAALAREDSRDCFLSEQFQKVSELPMGGRVGTSSLRRKTQLLRFHPNLVVEQVHGNVETRIRKMNEGHFDGIILAYAGVRRLGLLKQVREIFDPNLFYPSPGQGIIAVQCREGDSETESFLPGLRDGETAKVLECERSFLQRLEGGCQLPCGIHTELENDRIRAAGILLGTDRGEWVEAESEGTAAEAVDTGLQLAEKILTSGGEKILIEMRNQYRK